MGHSSIYNVQVSYGLDTCLSELKSLSTSKQLTLKLMLTA